MPPIKKGGPEGPRSTDTQRVPDTSSQKELPFSIALNHPKHNQLSASGCSPPAGCKGFLELQGDRSIADLVGFVYKSLDFKQAVCQEF